MDTTDRIAHHVAKLVRDDPGRTPGAVSRRLAGTDRPLFVESTVKAVKLGLVEVREGKLYPGPNEPRPGRWSRTAAALAEALAR